MKKAQYVPIVLSLILAFSFHIAHADTNTGLVAHWKFDEAGGTNAVDSAGSFPGSLVKSPARVAGKVGGALLFDGTDKFVQVPSAPSVVAPYSTSFWFYVNDVTSAQGFLAHGLSAGNNMISIGGGRIGITSYSSGTMRTWCNRPFTSADINKWHHLTIIINSTTDAGQWKCYVDGVDVGVIDAENAGTYANPGTTDWTIGAYYNNSYWLNGAMDDVRVYSRSLTSTDISELYALGGSGGGTTGGGTTGGSTTDTTPPVISSVSSGTVTSSSAAITWTTDELSDTQVEYGPTTSYGSVTTLDAVFTRNHSVVVVGLPANTLFHYRVKSRDGSGNLSTSGNFTFTTNPSTSYTQSGSTFNVTTCSQTDVQAAINAASPGNTINVPPGNCTWSTSVDVTKAVSIIGAGSGAGGTKLTATAALANGFFNVHDVTSGTLLRISGFYFDAVTWIPFIIQFYRNNALDKVRIDHNVFNQSINPLEIGGVKGVVDHNYFYNGQHAMSYTGGSRAQQDASWLSLAAGTGDALFFEDNTIIDNAQYPATYDQEKIATFGGGKLVIRNNTFDGTAWPLDGTWTPIMTHGSACGGCSPNKQYWQSTNSDARRGQAVVEIYNNVIKGKRVDFPITVRGSANLIWNNTITTTGRGERIALVEEEYRTDSNWSPFRLVWPAEDQVHNTFIWNNTINGAQLTTANIVAIPSEAEIKLNRDYFMHAPESSGGKEIFVCAPGVTECNGASGSYPTDGTVFPTKGTMVFVASGANAYYPYTPYVYPHPLVSGVAAPPPPPPVPTTYAQGDFNKDGVVNSVDLSLMASAWNLNNSTYDLTKDGTVNTLDYAIMVKNWTN